MKNAFEKYSDEGMSVLGKVGSMSLLLAGLALTGKACACYMSYSMDYLDSLNLPFPVEAALVSIPPALTIAGALHVTLNTAGRIILGESSEPQEPVEAIELEQPDIQYNASVRGLV